MPLVVLATNDLHGCLSPGKFEFLSALRGEADLYFDSGDAISSGNLAVPLRPEPVWRDLQSLKCDASCPGNRESHVVEPGFAAKTRGIHHPVVCSNWFRKDGSRVFPPSVLLTAKGLRIGVVGVMVPMVTRKMKTYPLSAFYWTDPVEAAREEAEKLVGQVEGLFLLSHIGHSKDLELAREVPLFDVVLGGHSHTVVESPVLVGKTAVCQGGSHAHFIGRYEWDPGRGLSGGLVAWP